MFFTLFEIIGCVLYTPLILIKEEREMKKVILSTLVLIISLSTNNVYAVEGKVNRPGISFTGGCISVKEIWTKKSLPPLFGDTFYIESSSNHGSSIKVGFKFPIPLMGEVEYLYFRPSSDKTMNSFNYLCSANKGNVYIGIGYYTPSIGPGKIGYHILIEGEKALTQNSHLILEGRLRKVDRYSSDTEKIDLSGYTISAGICWY